jgi:hypothetical protein
VPSSYDNLNATGQFAGFDELETRLMIERGHHDMGGLPAGKVEPTEHDYAEWERRVDALRLLLSGIRGGKKLMTVDELRKNIEALPPDAYERMSYYERWVTSITQTMIQRGVITTEELGRKMEEIGKRDGSKI